MSLNPSAATAFSHVDLSSIHPHPFAASSSHRPDGFIGANPTSALPGVAIAAISASTLTRPRTRRARFPPPILLLAGHRMERIKNTTNFDLLREGNKKTKSSFDFLTRVPKHRTGSGTRVNLIYNSFY